MGLTAAATAKFFNRTRISAISQHVLDGGHISRDEARWLFNLDAPGDIIALLSWANRLREKFKGNKIHLCSIVNAKAGACSENCSFCAQSSHYQTGSPQNRILGPSPVTQTPEGQAKKNRT